MGPKTERHAGAMLLELKAEGKYGSGKPKAAVGLPSQATTYAWQDMARVPVPSACSFAAHA